MNDNNYYMYGTGKCINDDLCLNTFFFGGHCVRSPSDLEEAMKYYNMALAINLKTLGVQSTALRNQHVSINHHSVLL